jgi:hypothetical protein
VKINETILWEGCLQDIPPGSCRMWHFYSETEDGCAREVKNQLTKYLNRVAKMNKLRGGRYIRHILWIRWISNYKYVTKK